MALDDVRFARYSRTVGAVRPRSPDQSPPSGRGFRLLGDNMPTLAEVEEALQHARAVPPNQRGNAWHAYVDSLLEQRVALAAPESKRRETRVVQFSEHR